MRTVGRRSAGESRVSERLGESMDVFFFFTDASYRD